MVREQESEQLVYNRQKAVAYARKWALRRNPTYYNFTGLGGDCANFTSQCIYEGAGIMNYKKLYGWYYNSSVDRAPSWSSVKYLHKFLTANKGIGPYASETDITAMQPGDTIQLATYLPEFHHTLIVAETGEIPAPDNILICAHSYDSIDRPLDSYEITKIRFIHIEGVREL